MYISMDFGTSFSQVATVKLGSPVLLHPPGEYGIPSEFYYDRYSGVLVGQEAMDEGRGQNAKKLLSNFKMKLDQDFTADGKTFSSTEMISYVYKELLRKANRIAQYKGYDTNVEGIVLTAPVRFGVEQKTKIENALKLAKKELGITNETVNIIKEPVAAAIYYFHQTLEKKRTILVFDLGGGTCDVAIVKSNSRFSEFYEVIDSDMVEIGGRDWDAALSNLIETKLKTDRNIIVGNDEGLKEKIRREAIKAKHTLSDGMHDSCPVRLEINGALVSVRVSAAEFEEVTTLLMAEAIECLRNIYNKNSANERISDIICVGGSSNMIQVKEAIEKNFSGIPVNVFYPEYAVVSGAAIFADMVKNSTTPERKLVDRASFAYGIECYSASEKRNYISYLIPKDAKLPYSSTGSYIAHNYDNQQVVSVSYKICESESDNIEQIGSRAKIIGEMSATHKSAKQRDVDLKITFTLTTSGMLDLKVVDENDKVVTSQFKVNS